MTYFADLSQQTMVAEGDHVRAVGWLHPDHPFPQGNVSPEFLARLKQFVAQAGPSGDALFMAAFAGIHECEFCNRAIGVANFGVPSDELLYVAPEMIVHYIEAHEYSPPEAFQLAVMKSLLPESEEYHVLCEPFWQLHRAAMERMFDMNG